MKTVKNMAKGLAKSAMQFIGGSSIEDKIASAIVGDKAKPKKEVKTYKIKPMKTVAKKPVKKATKGR